MKTGRCRCDNRIFFNNFACVACRAKLGRCCQCDTLTSFQRTESAWTCDACHAVVHRCQNHDRQVCNSFLSNANQLCKWCVFTIDIPDLSVPDNVDRWAAMEASKRQLLLQLMELKLPPYVDDLRTTHPLTFRFIEDSVVNGQTCKTLTGHTDGVITVNLAEADTVHRERQRVDLDEPQRTLIGHMRHEIGHYIDWAWASRVDREGYIQVFGDPSQSDYATAVKRCYQSDAPRGWEQHHVSRYASIHPWEDFAETVNVYLDLMAIAVTANDQGTARMDTSPSSDPSKLVPEVLKIVVEVSEYNHDLGLNALLPEKLPPTVIKKLAFVHQLRTKVMPTRTA